MQEKFKILVSCYACSPYRGSEPGMGWNFVYGLSKFHEVYVIVEKEKWEKDINKFLIDNPESTKNLHFYFIHKQRNRLLRKIWPPSYYWYYKKWQKKAYSLANELHKNEKFDLVHQLNMVGFREPGYLWKMDLPFVWGPIGGMEVTNWQFLSSLGLKGMLHYFARNVINIFQMNYMKRPKQAVSRNNKQLVAATPFTKEMIKKYWNENSDVICEVGQEKSEINEITKRTKDYLNIVWSGLHKPRKALPILLRALSMLNCNYKLHILGVGEETIKWKVLAQKLGISDNCIWYGWVKRDDALKVMKVGHVFCITSVHDLTSTVTLEALSYGLPIICLDHCGFSHVVNDKCGIKIPVESPKQAYRDFATAIEKVYNDEEFRYELASGAIKRAKDFSWDKKVYKLNEIYSNLIHE